MKNGLILAGVRIHNTNTDKAQDTMADVWMITGVSTGIGRALAREAALRGHIVAGSLRKAEQIAGFEAEVPGKTFGFLADVRRAGDLQAFCRDVQGRFGKIDVLVNNAGYGLVGAVEEISDSEARDQMEVNFFGALSLTREVLPVMRQQGRGHIFNVSSIAGLNGTAGLALYNASKFALEGLSEGLFLETRHLGIQVTLVEPGPFRTLWAGPGLVHAGQNLAAYQPVTERLRSRLAATSGQQAGDPGRAARLICDVALAPGAPLRLLLGKAGYDVIEAKIQRLSAELAAWKERGLATDYPA